MLFLDENFWYDAANSTLYIKLVEKPIGGEIEQSMFEGIYVKWSKDNVPLGITIRPFPTEGYLNSFNASLEQMLQNLIVSSRDNCDYTAEIKKCINRAYFAGKDSIPWKEQYMKNNLGLKRAKWGLG